MGLIQAKGSDIQFGGDVDLKTVFIRLKENQSVKVRVLGLADYIEYKAHSEFSLKVYTQPCIAPLGKTCPFCTASNSGIEGYKNLYARKRYLFAFADIETGALRVWDCSNQQAKDLLSQINEYKDNIADISFNFKRTGTGTTTSYKLNPILKMKANEQEAFNEFDGVEVPMKFFEDCLVPRTEQLIMDVLNDSGFPVNEYFPTYVPTGVEGANPATATGAEDGEPVF